MTIEEYLTKLVKGNLIEDYESLENVTSYRNNAESFGTISVFIKTNADPFKAGLKVNNFDNVDEKDLNVQLMTQIVKNANHECVYDWEEEVDNLRSCSKLLRIAMKQIDYLENL